MPIVPIKDLEALDFFETRANGWLTNATALGIPNALASAIKANTVAARTAYTAQQSAIAAARAATLNWQSALQTLRSTGANGIASIKATADNAANPDAIYSLAQIPAPTPPQPLPAPGTPTNLSCSILSTGALSLKWKMPSAQPGNTFYQITRRLPGEASFTIIGGSGNKTFVDETLPLGTDSVQYIVTAIRGNVSGTPSNAFVVQFGVGGNFVANANANTPNTTNTSGNNVKLAA